ncbi:sugar nucleotide-binding protein [Clostridium sp. WB02_MRS01]|uniref:sugar nucleotide-binding protein n=1 Tax=Clostridium sp. WB02_MRS01 TaxID=2605777 RepID=UPI0012B2CB68|nr:sugar nucleotide-binding protein [Clostridium sp. WB02_MRS01]MSS10444.1 sugar nucleotide-binding protein [Clostridium sp. WB02_MRS01]
MKILVLGASGMAGHTVSLYFKECGHSVTAFSTTPFVHCENIVGNAFDTVLLRKVITEGEFDGIINCIGILNQSAEDNKALAVYLNSYLPHQLVELSKGTRAKLIHMSTDCVFSGKTGNYTEESFKDGETFYDRSKALGEVIDNTNLTFRNSVVGPDINKNGIGLFNWFMKQRGTINGYTGAMWTGVTTLTLAKAMERAFQENLTGLYNLVNNISISKYDLLSLFNKYFGNGEIEILPSDKIKVNKQLVKTREDFSFVVPSYEQMVAEMYDWVIAHKELYPHYRR